MSHMITIAGVPVGVQRVPTVTATRETTAISIVVTILSTTVGTSGTLVNICEKDTNCINT